MSNDDTFDPYVSPSIKAPLDDDWAARREAADAARRLIETLVTTAADAAALRSVADGIRAQADKLAATTRLFGRLAFETQEGSPHGTPTRVNYELNPVDGKSNPLAPPLDTWITGDTVHGRTTLGWPYEGPPNCVHGGFVCALFDRFLGIAQRLTGQPGVTGTISVRLLRPTPLCAELELIAWIEKVQGRKNFIAGEIRVDGVATATCKAVYIHVDRERFRRLRDDA